MVCTRRGCEAREREREAGCVRKHFTFTDLPMMHSCGYPTMPYLTLSQQSICLDFTRWYTRNASTQADSEIWQTARAGPERTWPSVDFAISMFLAAVDGHGQRNPPGTARSSRRIRDPWPQTLGTYCTNGVGSEGCDHMYQGSKTKPYSPNCSVPPVCAVQYWSEKTKRSKQWAEVKDEGQALTRSSPRLR